MNEQQLQTIFDLAHKHGIDAANNVKSPSPVMGGSAWVVIEDMTSDFALYTKKKNLSRANFTDGREISCSKMVPNFITNKEAYVNAFAKTLRDYGIKATAKSKM